jgi:hypothetical protein
MLKPYIIGACIDAQFWIDDPGASERTRNRIGGVTRTESGAWSSESIGMAMEGDCLSVYRLWNGCFRRVMAGRWEDFHRSTWVANRLIPGADMDSLKVEFREDSIF